MNHNTQVSEVSHAMHELSVTRGMRFDQSDYAIWRERLDEHNHSGLSTEAARRFGEDEDLQDTPLTLAAFIRVVKQVRQERIHAMEEGFPQPPSGISDEKYQMWLRARNECAVRGLPREQIDQQARRAIDAPAPPAISERPAPVAYLPPASSGA